MHQQGRNLGNLNTNNYTKPDSVVTYRECQKKWIGRDLVLLSAVFLPEEPKQLEVMRVSEGSPGRAAGFVLQDPP